MQRTSSIVLSLLSVGLLGCFDHECTWRDVRCFEGEMQQCHCETVGGMIAANTCTEPRRWRPVGSGVVGCIDTPDGPRGSRETCPDRGMADYCEEGRAVSCRDAANGAALLFATYCRGGDACRVDREEAAVCAPSPDPGRAAVLLLYATHPVGWDGARSQAPARLPYEADLSTDSAAFVVVLQGDEVRAYRGGSIPLGRQATGVRWPRDVLARFLADPQPDEGTLETLVSDAEQALRFQAFYPRPLPHLRELVRASALWHAGEPANALTLIDRALERAPQDESLLAARAIIAQVP